jgi:hypothetical protein
MSRAALASCLAGALALVVGAACTVDATPCYPGDYVACTCGSGARGLSQCATDGAAYGVCDCSGKVAGTSSAPGPADGGAVPDGATDDGGKLAFLAPCSSNDQCSTNLCFRYNAKGPHCSMPCKVDSDCPAPAPGCNMMGVCKAP